jgi:hypothetical protein
MPGVQPPSQQATRHARRVYVGGLPPTGNEQNIATFFSNALAAIGGTTAGPGPSVVNVYINYEKKFAFVEFRTGMASPPSPAWLAYSAVIETRACRLQWRRPATPWRWTASCLRA